MISAIILFYGELNDFLSRRKKFKKSSIKLLVRSSLKDIIESQGVPHTEIGKILVDGSIVEIHSRVADGNLIEVFPSEYICIENIRFIADVHLGALARKLRLFGFDCNYRNDFDDSLIAEISNAEDRTVLTRDVKLLMRNKVRKGYWLRSQVTGEQLAEVFRRFNLADKTKPFTLCMECGGNLETVNKNEVLSQILPGTAERFDEFFRCGLCKKVYWEGSHYTKLSKIIDEFKQR
ncbi:hypothetical protein JW890_06800 [candidate division WOR-3 bacterium]|nr:hypothetical protein [candidate division WOR-3 bacterium]